jgi:hypothetical protein
MDAADVLGCEPVPPATPVPGCPVAGGNGVVSFTIGLGEKVVANTVGDPHSGEKLLRYIAAVGDDGDPNTDPCASTPDSTLLTPQNCGNYYFSPDATGLQPAFDDIAERIFTRITQ